MDQRREINRRNWDERVPVHAASSFYNVESFKAGRITINRIEREEIGPVAGKSLLHLQCHFGMDTMSWARLGARATGVDFSGAAIDLARGLNEELGLNARFIRSDVYDLPQVLEQRFDVVTTSLGVLVWLPDLGPWASVVANFVKPGGTFYLLDQHPLSHVFDEESRGGEARELRIRNSYFRDPAGELFSGDAPSYAGTKQIRSSNYQWQHSVADILNALTDAGLRLHFFQEFPFSFFQQYPGMVRDADGWWRLPQHKDSIPLIFSLRATDSGAPGPTIE